MLELGTLPIGKKFTYSTYDGTRGTVQHVGKVVEHLIINDKASTLFSKVPDGSRAYLPQDRLVFA